MKTLHGKSDPKRSFTALVPAKARVWFAVALSLAGCGGSTTPAASASESEPADAEEGANEVWREDAQEAEPRPTEQCSEGTCSPCGESVCLSGFYCEESVSACGWLPECVEDFTCACLQKTFPACSCEERNGGLYLSCE